MALIAARQLTTSGYTATIRKHRTKLVARTSIVGAIEASERHPGMKASGRTTCTCFLPREEAHASRAATAQHPQADIMMRKVQSTKNESHW